MRRLLPLLVVGFLLVGVGAAPAHADHRTDNLVIDESGDLTGNAKGVLRAGQFIPINGYSSWFLTQAVTIQGTLVPAGTQLTAAQATHVMTQPGGLVAVAQNAAAVGPPSNAIMPARQAAANNVIEEARRRGRVFPAARTVGTMAIVGIGTALPTYATALKMEIPGQQDLYRLIYGSETVSGGAATGLRWSCIGASPCPVTGVSYYNGSATVNKTDGWYYRYDGDNSVLWSNADYPTTGTCWATPGAIRDFCLSALAFTSASWWHVSHAGDQNYRVFQTDAQREAKTASQPTDGDTFNNWDSSRKVTVNYNQPTYNSGDDDEMRDTIRPSAGSQTQAEQDAEDAIAKAIDPAADPGLDPTTGTPNPVPIVPPATTIPSAPALDFTPLTDIDFGCKFPYGFLCYAVEVTEIFDVAPDAPRFVFDVPTVNVGIAEFGGGEDGWVVDLEVMDDWAAIWRDIWSVVIVIGAVYLVATRLLGFKAGGDPGAAMDDV